MKTLAPLAAAMILATLVGCAAPEEETAAATEEAISGAPGCVSLAGSVSEEALTDLQRSLASAAVTGSGVALAGAFVAERYTVYDWPRFALAGAPWISSGLGASPEQRDLVVGVGERQDVGPAGHAVAARLFAALTNGTESHHSAGSTAVTVRRSKAGHLTCTKEVPANGLVGHSCSLAGVVAARASSTCPER